MPNTENLLTIAADAADAGQRYDQFLAKQLPQFSRSIITKMIKDQQITLQGAAKAKPSCLIVGQEIFMLTVPTPEASYLVAENIALDILYNDEHIAVINKPAGMVVHPGAGVKHGTLCHALLYHFPTMSVGNVVRPGIVHRLDKHSTGVMIVAKTDQAHRILSEDFKARRVEKIYRAFCWGQIAATEFELKTGHARHPHHRLRFSTKMKPGERLAHTSFTILKRSCGITSVRAVLHTGRTHQIRAHLADIAHPLLGDDLYGGRVGSFRYVSDDLKAAIALLPGQALHAETLRFHHPITQERMEISSPLPPVLAKIDTYLSST